MKKSDEICSYIKGYVDGIVEMKLNELESRIAKLEKEISKRETKKSNSDVPKNIDYLRLRRDLKEVVKELSKNSNTQSATLDDVYSNLEKMNYSHEEIDEMIEKMSKFGELLLPKNNTIKLVGRY